MPLKIEVYSSSNQCFVPAGSDLSPGDQPGSISHNPAPGVRELYLFECQSDDQSVILRSKEGLDLEAGEVRIALPNPDQLEIVKTLGPNQSFELQIKTDISPEIRRVRFSHIR